MTQLEMDTLNFELNKFNELYDIRMEFEKFKESHLSLVKTVDRQKNKIDELLIARDIQSIESNTYKLIISKIKENQNLMDSWSDFLMTLKLTCPDVEEEFSDIANDMWRP